jgi:hypothetical protein
LFAAFGVGCGASPDAARVALTSDEVLARLHPTDRTSFATPAGQQELSLALRDRALLVAEGKRRRLHELPALRDKVAELEETLTVKALLAELESSITVSDVDVAAAMASSATPPTRDVVVAELTQKRARESLIALVKKLRGEAP